MTILFILAFILPLLLTLALTPVAMRLAFACNAIDQPDKRKVHSKPIPRLGGIAVASSFLVSIGALIYIIPTVIPETTAAIGTFLQPETAVMVGLGLSAILLILSLGAWDDISALNPGFKFFIQFAAATLAYLAGFKISLVSDPFGTGMINMELFSYPLTVIWIVGVTNAFNLIDGLDGLASGTAIIALAAIGTISFFHGQPEIVLICLLLGGSALGFLWYNFRPAKIFLGDSGSLFLGFILALLSIHSYTKVSASFAIFVPFFALGLPIIDTLLSMVRRFLSWFLPDRFAVEKNLSFKQILHSIFQPDKSHIHHQLIRRGLSHKHTVLVLYVVSAVFGAGAVAIALTSQFSTTILILLTITAFILTGINKLKYKEIALLHNGIFLTFYNRLLINRQNIQKAFDMVFILAAFTGAFLLTQPGGFSTAYFASGSDLDLSLLLFVLLVQTSVFWLSGLYRETIQQLGIADAFQITKSMGLASIAAAIAISLAPFWQLEAIATLFLLNFYFLVTFVLGIRLLFHLVKYLFRCSREGKEMALIYGAGEQGILTLHRLLAMDSEPYTPMGFLDEDPQLEGKKINGLPVFGGHWKLEQLIRKQGITHLLISDENLKPAVLQRIESIAGEYDINVKKFQVQINELPFSRSAINRSQQTTVRYAN
jgi:UDP-GlcNAc:undecaprenyl-phosphate/decaprenyl-phosphate GlcNAc-1-phosphate transferase